MKKKKVWRYYCEFCKKSGCSGGHLSSHEKSCTNNPDRVCKMCNAAGLNQKSIAELIKTLGLGDKAGVDALREATDGCPACMLSAIRQSGLQIPDNENGPGFSVDFIFSQEKDTFWGAINQEVYEDDLNAHYPY